MAEDQSAQIALLMDPATHGGANTQRIDTHGAIVVLAGERAFKLKRAVKFPFLDYSTAERRRRFCEEELRLNRRTAPELYVAVRPVLRAESGLRLGEPGEHGAAIDWVLEMRRFPDGALLDERARQGTLDEPVLLALADEVAAFHGKAERRTDQGGPNGAQGGAQGGAPGAMRQVVDMLVAGLRAEGNALDQAKVAAFAAGAGEHLTRHATLLDQRRAAGYVRHGHGDLHLRNVCLWRGRPTLFDAIEFDEAMACIDILYDLAFLLMDLLHRGMAGAASAVFNRYVARSLATDDTPGGLDGLKGLALLPLFLSVRAAVRARVEIASANAQPDPSKKRVEQTEARAYLDLALRFQSPPPPRLIAIGGLSGTGKSTLAHALAPDIGPAPGALALRSDVLRKTLMGVDLFQRLPQEGYDPRVTRRVFDGLARGARMALAAGHAVIADAVYLRAGERRAIAAVAAECGADFTGLWLEAPQAELERRVEARTAAPGADVSDATAEIVRLQARARATQDPGPMEWTRIDAAQPLDRVAKAARTIVGVKT